jgi:hypothetical protein
MSSSEPSQGPVDSGALASQAPAQSPVPSNVWAYGSHDRQVPLAGLLVDDPSLRGISLTPDEWRQRVDAYLVKPA